jgi:hypothetical protein
MKGASRSKKEAQGVIGKEGNGNQTAEGVGLAEDCTSFKGLCCSLATANWVRSGLFGQTCFSSDKIGVPLRSVVVG